MSCIEQINNKGKYVIAERFIRKLKNKIYKYMTSSSKNVYIERLHDIVKEYNNIYHKSIKMIIHTSILKRKSMTKILNLKLVIM